MSAIRYLFFLPCHVFHPSHNATPFPPHHLANHLSCPIYYAYLVIDEIPHGSRLMHITELDTRKDNLPTPPSTDPAQNLVHLGGGLPPVPGKLTKKIEESHFIKMTELLPECLSSQGKNDDPNRPTRPKRKVIGILEWVQCSGIYMAVISHKEPHRVEDLLWFIIHHH